MYFDRTVWWIFAIVIAAIAGWTAVLIYGIGPDTVLAALQDGQVVSVHKFGQLGSAYGILASIFAGFAVILLWQNIRVQQKELSELRAQMEHDRSLSTFVWILEHYKEVRSSLVFRANHAYVGGTGKFYSSDGVGVVKELFLKLQKARAGGGYVDRLKGKEMKAIVLLGDEENGRRCIAAAAPVYQLAIDVAGFILREVGDVRHRLLRLAWSVITSRDLLVIHELCLFEGDEGVKALFTDISFFGGLEQSVLDQIGIGPRLPKAAYHRQALES